VHVLLLIQHNQIQTLKCWKKQEQIFFWNTCFSSSSGSKARCQTEGKATEKPELGDLDGCQVSGSCFVFEKQILLFFIGLMVVANMVGSVSIILLIIKRKRKILFEKHKKN
jgi:hypothetical protein